MYMWKCIQTPNIILIFKNMTARTEKGKGSGFCDDNIEGLVLKNVTMGGGRSIIAQDCVTSFMEDEL